MANFRKNPRPSDLFEELLELPLYKGRPLAKGPLKKPGSKKPQDGGGARQTVFDRPFLEIQGPRHVPHLVNANGTAMLRYKKPQDMRVTQLIGSRIDIRQRRTDRMERLEHELAIAEHEDLWDRLVRHVPLNDHTTWTFAIKYALKQEMDNVQVFNRKQQITSRVMTEIHNDEIELREMERAARRCNQPVALDKTRFELRKSQRKLALRKIGVLPEE